MTVMAVTEPSLGAYGGITAFIVETDSPGFSIGSLENKMGIRVAPPPNACFKTCACPRKTCWGSSAPGS